MAVTFQISGLDRVGAKLARLGPLFVQQARELVHETVLFGELAIADKIDQYDAIDEGRLKGSVTRKDETGKNGKSYTFDPADTATKESARNVSGVAQVEAVLGTNVRHAIPVHEGYTTRSGREIPGRPFMEDALPEIEEHFERRAHERFGSLL